jgi:hypothetical protein
MFVDLGLTAAFLGDFVTIFEDVTVRFLPFPGIF